MYLPPNISIIKYLKSRNKNTLDCTVDWCGSPFLSCVRMLNKPKIITLTDKGGQDVASQLKKN